MLKSIIHKPPAAVLLGIILSGNLSLPYGLIEANACSDTDIETFNTSGHGNLEQEVTVFLGQTPHSLALSSHHQSQGPCKSGVVEGALSGITRAHQPHPQFLKLAHGS